MIHFDGNSSQHFSFEVEQTNSTLVGRFGDGNTPLFTYTYMLNNEQPMRINATNFMAALWVIYGLKVANSKSYAYNNFFHAWWQLECYCLFGLWVYRYAYANILRTTHQCIHAYRTEVRAYA